MLFDENKNYKEMNHDKFELEIGSFKGNSNIIGTIYYFYKDDKGNIIKKSRSKVDVKPLIKDDYTLISKYYVIEVKVDEPLCFDYEDIGNAYKIYNVGNFFISDIFKMDDEQKKIIKSKFDLYDEKYKNMVFPWNDEEFIIKFNKRNI